MLLLECEEEWERYKKILKEYDFHRGITPTHYPCIVVDTFFKRDDNINKMSIHFEFIYKEDFNNLQGE